VIERRYLSLAVLCLVVVGGVAGAVAVGFGPAETAVDSILGESTVTEDSAGGDAASGQSAGDGEAGSADSGDDAANEQSSEFDFTVRDIEECGRTCRDVTVGLTNTMNTTATDVEVTTRIYTGESEVWSASESFSEVAAGASKTQTKRVKIGYLDAAKIEQNDGEVRIETTVTWDGGEQSFSERRKVA
jgi:hypothetical protein